MQTLALIGGQDLCCLMIKTADKPEVVQLPAETQVAAPVSNRRAAAQRVREAQAATAHRRTVHRTEVSA